MSDFAIETNDLRKTFGGKSLGPFKSTNTVNALRGVNFKIKHGENYCLLGPNGAGKTTLIRCVLGLLDADGKVKVLGHEMPKDRENVIPKIGYMPQDLSLYTDLSVKESLHFFGRIFGLNKKSERMRSVETLLDFFVLKKWQKTKVENLSGGMKRRLSLACTLVHDPKLLILDEPTVGVDPALRITFWDYFKELNEKGTTIITTTHVMDEAEKSNVIGFMRDGKLIAEGTYSELRKNVPEKRKLIVEVIEKDTNNLKDKISNQLGFKTKSDNYKIEIFYNNDSEVDDILKVVEDSTKIRTIQTEQPNLEDTFIYFSKKKNTEGMQ
ncbi:MAG: ATP-binding cassette domain-containing protein [Candidatus Lokiarchaeota archaeon]|nr:ATP-binding cassette domain-containing protein [Candidatus Lokiarchaeota archaeon]